MQGRVGSRREGGFTRLDVIIGYTKKLVMSGKRPKKRPIPWKRIQGVNGE